MQSLKPVRRTTRGVVALASMLALAACGSSDEEATEAPETTTPEETSVSDQIAPSAYAEENIAFLAENAAKEGWTTTEEGIQYFVEQEGDADGEQPKEGDYVRVHYVLNLIDGTQIDSSFDRGETAVFQLADGLIPGWIKAIPLMKTGARYNFAMPAELGYGARDVQAIPANSTLLFTVELIDVLDEAALEAERERMIAERAKLVEEHIARQTAYLDENAKKDGVTVTESGLQYEILASGDASGPQPAIDTQVEVHYRGTLIDGSQFDSSYDRGRPATFAPNQVIPAWTEALQMMRPGDKWKLTVPQQLGYGERGSPSGSIPPFATLIFEVEIISIPE